MILRRPRIAPVAATALLAGVLALFAVELRSTAAEHRRQVERRFADKAAVSAALTGSMFASSAGQSAARHPHAFGDARVDPGTIEMHAGIGFQPALPVTAPGSRSRSRWSSPTVPWRPKRRPTPTSGSRRMPEPGGSAVTIRLRSGTP